jgi:LacI family transcriptional regulator
MARKAGVSRSTVSRVINNEAYVSEKIRQRVLTVIEQEGFSPNPAARMLASARTQIIAVVLPYPMQAVFQSDEPYYIPRILQGISQTLQQHDYAMLLWLANPSEDTEGFYQRVLRNRLMDGLVIVASVSGEELLLATLRRSNTPFVLIGRPLLPSDSSSFVSIDNVAAAQEAVQHLINLGRRRIGTITGNAENADGQDRLAAYRATLQANGIPYDPELVVEGQFTREAGYKGMKQLLAHRIDALFAASDIIAKGAMQIITEAGLRVPDDIAIVGFDDLPHAEETSPPLTTVRQPVFQKGSLAASLLIDLIEGKTDAPSQILLPTQLVIRQSCGAMQG